MQHAAFTYQNTWQHRRKKKKKRKSHYSAFLIAHARLPFLSRGPPPPLCSGACSFPSGPPSPLLLFLLLLLLYRTALPHSIFFKIWFEFNLKRRKWSLMSVHCHHEGACGFHSRKCAKRSSKNQISCVKQTGEFSGFPPGQLYLEISETIRSLNAFPSSLLLFFSSGIHCINRSILMQGGNSTATRMCAAVPALSALRCVFWGGSDLTSTSRSAVAQTEFLSVWKSGPRCVFPQS